MYTGLLCFKYAFEEGKGPGPKSSGSSSSSSKSSTKVEPSHRFQIIVGTRKTFHKFVKTAPACGNRTATIDDTFKVMPILIDIYIS